MVFAHFANSILGPRRQKFIWTDRQQFGPAANVHFDRQQFSQFSHQVGQFGLWRPDIIWIANNLSLGGKDSFVESSDRMIGTGFVLGGKSQKFILI